MQQLVRWISQARRHITTPLLFVTRTATAMSRILGRISGPQRPGGQ